MSNTSFLSTITNNHKRSAIKFFQLTSLSCALALAGCGGGGGTVDSIDPRPDLGVGGSTGGSGSGTGTGGGETESEVKIKKSALVDVDGNAINSIGLEGAYYQVEVVDKANKPIANAKVSFSIDAQGVVLTQSTSGSVLTDTNGMAQIFLKPQNAEVSGAYTISALADFGNQTANSNKTFSVQATNVVLSKLTIENKQLPSGGQTPVSLQVTDTNGKALSGVLVNLNSSCGDIVAQVSSDTDGMVRAVYKAINADNSLCGGNVRLSASTGNKTQSETIEVASPEATSIIYTANDLTMGIQNSGSSSTGQIEFTVYSNSSPLANQKVELSLEKAPLGLTFGPEKKRESYIATTDENGKVQVNLYPGSTPGPVEVKATLVSDENVNALSKNITVASSRVTQTGLSISWEKNVLDWSADGNTAVIQARMSDRNGNKVPDGTVINFTAEGGKITSDCSTVDGVCQVTFSTQNSRPGDGRVSVLAVAEGEKDYIDTNGNNAWDKDDIFVYNIGDTYRDDNENHKYDQGEFTYPSKGGNQACENNLDQYINLKFPTLPAIKRTQYKARYVAEFVYPNRPDTCNDGLDAVVRYQGITLLSDSNNARFVLGDVENKVFTPRPEQVVKGSDNLISVRMNSGGFYDLNPMPSGTTITGVASDETSSKPTAVIVPSGTNNYVIKVNGANANSFITVKKGEVEFPVTTNANGSGQTAPFSTIPDGDISIEQETKDCEASLVAGVTKVPANVAVGKPGDNLGTVTTFKLKNCQAGDEFKVTATAPNGNVTSYTYTIK
ncbi:Ig-like domain-containing protein [Psychrobacter sp. I-STPA6b]|uniref:Ig-like domain-containing protein n=1 Tax=Psychrobacter sp. I-STPA6b TaxID=2585718 RepID=UPI001D0C1BE2|nr:Ig-like domain-containing protein [Psychrobacter sp. I-STPA6b]